MVSFLMNFGDLAFSWQPCID